MTQLHLSEDEWATILLTLKSERERAANSAGYNLWLDAIIIKIDVVIASAKGTVE